MCVIADFSKHETLKKDLHVYKAVCLGEKKGEYHSLIPDWARVEQRSYMGRGKVLIYKLGVQARSRFANTPGIYCYVQYGAAYLHVTNKYHHAVLLIKVPKGSRIVRGCSSLNYKLTINAETIVPVKVLGV